jgi:hypothetical protein
MLVKISAIPPLSAVLIRCVVPATLQLLLAIQPFRSLRNALSARAMAGCKEIKTAFRSPAGRPELPCCAPPAPFKGHARLLCGDHRLMHVHAGAGHQSLHGRVGLVVQLVHLANASVIRSENGVAAAPAPLAEVEDVPRPSRMRSSVRSGGHEVGASDIVSPCGFTCVRHRLIARLHHFSLA